MVDLDSKVPLEGITVSIPSVKRSTVTDQHGLFFFYLAIDKYDFFFSSFEYKRVSQVIYIADQDSIVIELKKRPPTDLPEVTIEHRAKDANISEISMSTVNINPAMLRKTPLVFGEADLIKALTLQTGISTIGEGAGGFSVRGGNSDQNLILLDGAPLYNSAHLLGFYSTVSPEAVQDFTLYKGAFPASSGGRLSSLLSLSIRPGNPDSIHYGGSVSPVSVHLFGEGPLIRKSKLTFSADGRLAYPKLLMNQFPGSVSSSNAFFYDGIGKLSYRFNRENQVSISFYRSYDIFKFPGDTSYNWQSDIIALNGKSALNEKWSVYYGANISYYSSGIYGT
ncbi:MAG TPA: TonB-dependent receptor plug domain-containing protein, partial [Puia sp.]|nr:TonB-dependent receptor plug domain-containing protein [Puia sp.]